MGKLAAVIKKTADSSLLLSYEEERRNVDAKITKAVETGTTVFSQRSALMFFIRGRPQRIIGYTLSMLPESAKALRGWNYDNSSLSFEHWERASVLSTLADVVRCDQKIYRRRQNLHRWRVPPYNLRVGAGESVPPVIADGKNLYEVIKESRGWTLLLFEGIPYDNEEAKKHGLPVLNAAELQAFAKEMKHSPDKDGYVGFIDKVVVFPSSDEEAHNTFGVMGQCLFLVRPDTYVGLRSEPIRKGAITKYFQKIGGINVPAHPCPASAPNFDSFVLMLLTFVVSLISAIVYVTR